MSEFWVNSASHDWEVVNTLYDAGKYMHCLFFAHLTIEKLIKAHWVMDNDEDYPPRVHNLEYLLNQTNLELKPRMADELRIITAWYIEGRYQDYRDRFYKLCTKGYTKEKLKNVKEIREWLLKKLQ